MDSTMPWLTRPTSEAMQKSNCSFYPHENASSHASFESSRSVGQNSNGSEVNLCRENEKKGQEIIETSGNKAQDVSPIPNGGLTAWLQVLGGFFLLFNSWGIINTFGSFQAYYETNLLADSSPSSISWIGSIQAFLLVLVGALTGPIYDAGYFRALLLTGSAMLVLGQMMLSLCQTYYQVLLAQAFCIGIGAGCLFIPSIAILSTYFSTHIGLAIGLAASGSSLGGVIYPIVFHKLLPQIGFAWSTRVLGFIILGTMMIPNACMRVRVLPATSRSLIDLRAFALPAYSLQVVGFFLGFMGLYMPFFYVQVYAVEAKITTGTLVFYLLPIMNGTSVIGRIVPNLLSDKIGPFNAVIPCSLISALLCICFIPVSTTPSVIVLIACYGFFSGAFVSLPPTIIVHLSADARNKIGTRLGQSFGIVAFGLLIGTPIGGAILEHGGFVGLWVFAGSLFLDSDGSGIDTKEQADVVT
ncbi:MFS general substrate transporter [Stemphylium lycopersici]|uniref:MFS general substrate transporter n=1 Tax=Stemphylium lycopersici TaxID=183478 RepID=A0A364MYG0_STELY|nr:major facilitator superfamily protein [Stemphylium lycopersici]RAR05257.1 MFS general substrate transporter [Stemphylium lycopersici]RAR07170.1 MFS general substrate transporter [Stemphylium lycopersici]